MESDLTIVGAGITGLTAAIEAAEQGWRVTVAEAHSRPGGRIRSMADSNPRGNGDSVDGAPLSRGSPFGELLRRHRLACGLSQEELGEQAGLGVRTICDIERGRTTRPHRKTVSMLAAALEIKGDGQAEFLRVARVPGAGPRPAEPPAQCKDPHPRGLPAPVSQFVGRVSELQALDELAEGGGPLVAIISGAAGIGKTTLALHWAHRAAGDFPDEQLYLNLRGFDPSGQKLTASEAIRILLDGLRVPTACIGACTGRWMD